MPIAEDEFNFYKLLYDGRWLTWGSFDNFTGLVFLTAGCIEYSRVHTFLKLTDIRFIVWTFEFETIRSFSWDALSLALLDKDSLLLKRLEITEIKIN